jgi:hypothetical protein
MCDPTGDATNEVETDELVGADDVFELDDVRATKGGPGSVFDGHGGQYLL